jgi:uncharacterized membrane protein
MVKQKSNKKSVKKKVDISQLEKSLENNIQLSRMGMGGGLALGTVFLALGIFLPKEINEIAQRIFEYSTAGVSYISAGVFYYLCRKTQALQTDLHMNPEYIDAFHKSLFKD